MVVRNRTNRIAPSRLFCTETSNHLSRLQSQIALKILRHFFCGEGPRKNMRCAWPTFAGRSPLLPSKPISAIPPPSARASAFVKMEKRSKFGAVMFAFTGGTGWGCRLALADPCGRSFRIGRKSMQGQQHAAMRALKQIRIKRRTWRRAHRGI